MQASPVLWPGGTWAVLCLAPRLNSSILFGLLTTSGNRSQGHPEGGRRAGEPLSG
jgi:hypothetical protein